jgi:hypothetical protein
MHDELIKDYHVLVEKKYYGKCHTMHGNCRLNDISSNRFTLHHEQW